MPEGYIQTFTGRRFFPLSAAPGEIDIRDIAHSLALQCRFNGHCREFYSVAQHCVAVAALLPPSLALWGLLHDAAEAYLGDLPRPVKQQLPQFSDAEDRLLELIAGHFNLGWPMPAQVKRADDIMLVTEARDLMGMEWFVGPDIRPEAQRVMPVGPAEAERMFLARFEQLAG